MNDFKFQLGEFVCCIYYDFFTQRRHIQNGVIVSQIRHRDIDGDEPRNYYEVATPDGTRSVSETYTFKVLYCEN